MELTTSLETQTQTIWREDKHGMRTEVSKETQLRRERQRLKGRNFTYIGDKDPRGCERSPSGAGDIRDDNDVENLETSVRKDVSDASQTEHPSA